MANGIFGKDDAMIRIDMSEDGKRHAVARLVFTVPGFEGCDKGGQLTGKVRRQPCSVVLPGEIETARPDVCNILLQVFDDRRPSDGKGRVIDFRQFHHRLAFAEPVGNPRDRGIASRAREADRGLTGDRSGLRRSA